MPSRRIGPGDPWSRGARFDGAGVNFAVMSESATGIDVCLFDAVTDPAPRERISLPERTANVYHGYVPGLKPGQLYGLRVHGPWAPERGHRFNAAKLLVDPYARAIANAADWRAPLLPHKEGLPLEIDPEDDAWGAPKCVVVDEAFDWGDDAPPRRPWTETVLYEVHVKGFTALHPGVPAALRGTYAGFGSEASIAHLLALGVTAVELLPVHEKTTERAVAARGLVNHWGYQTLGFFAPEGSYAAGGRLGQQVVEFKRMVRALHAAGIEVILDVVYNHTCEGDHLGAALSLKGIDNRVHYRLLPTDPSRYVDYTGCGNTLDLRHPEVLKLVVDSLRYWVTEMHVDGFRFDLASTLARGDHDFSRAAAFLDIVHQDPVLSRTKLIAEPWDLGAGGYQVGGFPVLWSEWNGKYRDAVRRFWKGAAGIGEMGFRLTGSSDVYAGGGRGPTASVNFVIAHDGFTLWDLVRYDRKHNLANGEDNRDGSDGNDSDAHGVEGPSDDPAIEAVRDRQVRNMLVTLLVSQGVPMLSGGDELGRTQGGNNNAYCQDNVTSWHDWDLDARRKALLAFTQRLVALRAAQPVLRQRTFFSGGPTPEGEGPDVAWFTAAGAVMTGEDWGRAATQTLGMRLDGRAIAARDAAGEPVVGDTLLVLINAGSSDVAFRLPSLQWGGAWSCLVDTRAWEVEGQGAWRAGERYELVAKSVAVFRLR